MNKFCDKLAMAMKKNDSGKKQEGGGQDPGTTNCGEQSNKRKTTKTGSVTCREDAPD